MEGNNLISKAGMVFNSDDKWKLIPLTQENLQAFLQAKFVAMVPNLVAIKLFRNCSGFD